MGNRCVWCLCRADATRRDVVKPCTPASSAVYGAARLATCSSTWAATRTVCGWSGLGGLSPPANPAMTPPCAPPRLQPAAAAVRCRQTCHRPSHLRPRRTHSPRPRISRRRLTRCRRTAGPQSAHCCAASSATGLAARPPPGTTSRFAVHALDYGLRLKGCATQTTLQYAPHSVFNTGTTSTAWLCNDTACWCGAERSAPVDGRAATHGAVWQGPVWRLRHLVPQPA
jgi:hypothetical protein